MVKTSRRSILRLSSSLLSTGSTSFLGSDVFAKLPVWNLQGICGKEEAGGGGGLRRGCGFGDDCERYGRGDSGVDFVPDDLVWLFAEDCF